MKRLFLIPILAGILLGSLKAQTVEFRYHGEPVADGATVLIEAEEDAVFGDITAETNPPSAAADGLVLFNLTNGPLTGTSHLGIPFNTLGAKTVQWCMGGLCVPIPGNSYDKEISLSAGGSIQVQLDAVGITKYGEMLANIQVSVGGQVLTVRVNFVHKDASAPSFVKRSVVEEYTGTWCGYCPRGIVGMRLLEEQFGDRFIPIAVHNDDPMEITGYKSLVPSGLPKCKVDRGEDIDPYGGSSTYSGHYDFGFGLADDFAAALALSAPAGLELQAEWADEQQWDVRFTTSTTFGAFSSDAPYRLAFILMEDGLTGDVTDRSWAQTNYFNADYGKEADKYGTAMDEFKNAPYYVTGLAYDHVPVNTLGIQSGIQGSITAPITAGLSQTYSNLVTTLNQKVIQDKTRLWAVALLLDTNTGRVVNAARADIAPYGSSAGINLTRTDDIPSGNGCIYDLQGRRIMQPTKGIYVRAGRKYVVR